MSENHEDDAARMRRERTRWYLLQTLHVMRPDYCTTEHLLAVVQAEYPSATHKEVRREVDYLEERELVKVVRDPTDRWACELTRHGVDVYEYTVPCEPGIARPPRRRV